MAKQVELLYEDRCNIASLGQCTEANFNDCLSVFPTPTCPASPDFAIAQCASSSTSDTNNQEGCSGLYDFEHSTVALPSSLTDGPGRNPTDAKVIETICFTRELDSWFINKQESDRSYWQGFDVESPQMYFGSHNGIFRKFPGSSVNTKECGRYDPRVRPWYVAASSGPKNIIMILDTSGSMKDFNRLPLLKEAAKRVIDTLAVGDRIAIVDFATKANFNSRFLLTATDENKKKLRKYVDGFTADGATNFLDAFEQAFDILDASIDDELAVRCNTALLFLTGMNEKTTKHWFTVGNIRIAHDYTCSTLLKLKLTFVFISSLLSCDFLFVDGEMTEPAGARADDVLNKVDTRIQAASAQTGRPVVLFTYSVGAGSGVATLPSALACSVEFGVWSKIDRSDKIVESLASYYRLFALGLGSDVNADFNAWVEPYVFAGSGQLGTTVSVPVYDRSKTPNLFLGVVGVDFPISALDKALGVESGENGASVESVGRISDASTARCPVLELTPCELESYRILGSNEARCNANCTAQDFVEVEEGSCVAVSDYPRDL